MKKIWIYDDIEDFAEEFKETLEKLPVVKNAFEVGFLNNEQFKEEINTLRKRRSLFRKGKELGDNGVELDGASILIIDFDLQETEVYLNCEEVAYIARCFSDCGVIVGMNRFGHNNFDLTLKDNPESFIDFYIGQDQLNNPDIWQGTWGDDREGFRPWYWPSLPDYLCDFEKKVKDVRENLNIPIYNVLGFDYELFDFLPRSISQFIGGEQPVETTFRQFIAKSGNGLQFKDTKETKVNRYDEILARVGASRISKWLEFVVLPEQDILVDAPHLVSRYTSLLKGDVNDIKAWNKVAQLTNHEELGMQVNVIDQFRLKKKYWLSRPVWFWQDLRESADIVEVTEPWKAMKPDWVFCEDSSCFYGREFCREFVVHTESPFARRYAKYFDDIDYQPMVRFSL